MPKIYRPLSPAEQLLQTLKRVEFQAQRYLVEVIDTERSDRATRTLARFVGSMQLLIAKYQPTEAPATVEATGQALQSQ